VGGERTVKKLKLSKALTIPEGTTVFDACRRMAARRVNAVLLTDANALLSGIVTDKVHFCICCRVLLFVSMLFVRDSVLMFLLLRVGHFGESNRGGVEAGAYNSVKDYDKKSYFCHIGFISHRSTTEDGAGLASLFNAWFISV